MSVRRFNMNDNGASGGSAMPASYPTSPPIPLWTPPLIGAPPTLPPGIVPAPPTAPPPPPGCKYHGCQLPFTLVTGKKKKKKAVQFNAPITVGTYQPYNSATLPASTLWCPMLGILTVCLSC